MTSDSTQNAGADEASDPVQAAISGRDQAAFDCRTLAAYAVNLARGKTLAPFEFEHLAAVASGYGMGDCADWSDWLVAQIRLIETRSDAIRWRQAQVVRRPWWRRFWRGK